MSHKGSAERTDGRETDLTENNAGELLSITMTRSAALTFYGALIKGAVALTPDLEPPVNDRERARAEAADWLRWGMGRVTNADASIAQEHAQEMGVAHG